MKTIHDFKQARSKAIHVARQMADGSSLNLVKYFIIDTRRNNPPEICNDFITAQRLAGINDLLSVPDYAYIFAVARYSHTEIEVRYCLPVPAGIDPTETNITFETKFIRDIQKYQAAKQKAIDYFINEVSESITDDIKTFIVVKYPELKPKAVQEYETALKLAGIKGNDSGNGYVFHIIANGTKFIHVEYVNPNTLDVPKWATAGKIFANVRGLGKLLRNRSTNQPIKTL